MSAAQPSCPAHLELALDVARSEERFKALVDLVSLLRLEILEIKTGMSGVKDQLQRLTQASEVRVAQVNKQKDYLVAKITGVSIVVVALIESAKAIFLP